MNRYLPILLFAAATIVTGCDDPPIERYQAPKTSQSLVTAPTRGAMPSLPDSAAPPVDHGLSWTLPESWTQSENTSSMRIATFHAGEGTDRVEISVTTFPGDVGGTLANINRWRGQLNLAPVDTLEDQPMDVFTVAQRTARLVSLPGMLAAMIEDTDSTWFVKLTGSPKAVELQQDAMESFVRSLQWESR